jgi:hypothetical protein
MMDEEGEYVQREPWKAAASHKHGPSDGGD